MSDMDLDDFDEQPHWSALRPKKRYGRGNAADLSGRTRAIVAARKRGWSLEQIGFAANITRERVRQILEIENIPRQKLANRHRSRTSKQKVCVHCGRSFFYKSGQQSAYCSYACSRRAMRIGGGNAAVISVIERRLAGENWSDICRDLGHSYQGYARSIYVMLNHYKLLLMPILNQIYASNRAIEYQVRSTGFIPVQDYCSVSPKWFDRLKEYVAAEGDGVVYYSGQRDYESKYSSPGEQQKHRKATLLLQEEIEALFDAGWTTLQVAMKFGHSRNWAESFRTEWRQKHGLAPLHDGGAQTKKDHNVKARHDQREQGFALLAQGMSVKQVAQELDANIHTVESWRQRRNALLGIMPKKKERLTPEEAKRRKAETRRRWRHEHKQEIANYNHAYRLRTSPESRRQWLLDNRERVLEYGRAYRLKMKAAKNGC